MNWRTRIDSAVRNKRFTPEDQELIRLWGTCVMSELDARIPKKANGQPLDFQLVNDALAITTNVRNDNPEVAKTLYEGIKKREARLLSQLEGER